jgi:hypothetical protein
VRFALVFMVVLAAAGCGGSMSAWRPMPAPQLSVPLAPGAAVEIRNEREGWTERVDAAAL